MFHAEGLDELIAERLNIWSRAPDLADVAAHRRALQEPVARRREDRHRRQVRAPQGRVQVAPRGARPRRPRRTTAASSSSTSTASRSSSKGPRRSSRTSTRCSCPGGFGDRGTEGKIAAIGYAREQQDPVLRHLPGDAARRRRVRAARRGPRGRELERVRQGHAARVIDLMPEQRGVRNKGATMRLGAYPCVLAPGIARGRGVRHDRDQRAAPPPLRVRQRLPRPARRRRGSSSAAPRPTSASSR